MGDTWSTPRFIVSSNSYGNPVQESNGSRLQAIGGYGRVAETHWRLLEYLITHRTLQLSH